MGGRGKVREEGDGRRFVFVVVVFRQKSAQQTGREEAGKEWTDVGPRGRAWIEWSWSDRLIGRLRGEPVGRPMRDEMAQASRTKE